MNDVSKTKRKSTKAKCNYLLLFALLPILLACEDPGVIAFEQGNTVKWSGLEEIPPGNVTDIKDVMTLGDWNLEYMSLSPNGGLLALGLRKNNNLDDGVLDAKVMIFNIYRGILLKEYEEDMLKQIIEENSNLQYPSAIVDFNPRNLAWMNNNELLMNIQPIIAGTGLDQLPQDVAMVVQYSDTTVSQGPNFYSRTDPSPITEPDHPQKTAFASENRNGTIYIGGSAVNGLPSGIGMFEFVYLGN